MSDHAYPDALPSQYRLHWYRLERVLGQGGFGITYLARDTNLDQAVAIKEYLPVEVATRRADSTVRPRADDQSDRYRWGLDRFLREARTLARFDHPNIVRVLSVFEFNGTAYMVMRFEEGENFAALLERRRTVAEDELMRVLLPVLDGLELIHNAGFIHRDIKPDNIHIRVDGSPVLLDFGSARGSLGQGRTVTILVAPGYAPFEQYYSSGENQGPWTDLYGLGATCYRAIAGVAPLDAITRSKGVLGSAREILVPARTIAAGRYSERVLRAVDHALEFAEKDRPQSIAEWRSELQAPAAEASSAGSAAPVATPSVPREPLQSNSAAAPAMQPPSNRIAILAGLAVIAALAGAFGAYFALQAPKPDSPPIAAIPPSPAPPVIQPAVSQDHKPPVVAEPDAQNASASKPTPVIAEPPAASTAPPQRNVNPPSPKEKAPKASAPAPKPIAVQPPPQPATTSEQVAAVAPPPPGLNPPAGDRPAFLYHLDHAHKGNGEATMKVAESYESGRGVAQNGIWACGWYEVAARRGVAGARARKDAVAEKLQAPELRQCRDFADSQSGSG